MSQGLPHSSIAAQIRWLQRPLPRRGRLSWAAFLLVLAACLIVPFAASLLPSWLPAARTAPPATPTSEHPAAFKLDTVWDVGPVSSKHQPWAKDCKTCHSTPFKQVQDTDCLSCHKSIGDHVERKVAPGADLQDTRCASCHREHHGEFSLAEQNKRYVANQCSSCHGNIAAQFPKTLMRNVTDFSRDHPAFRVQIGTPEGKSLMRMRQEPSQEKKTALKEATGLKFPHDAHLDLAGIRTPQGKVHMVCADCHRPNADGAGFKRITMKETCQSCHALKFEAAAFNREVPHGSVEEVLTTLREFYGYAGAAKLPLDAKPAAGTVTMARPGRDDDPGTFISAPGDARRRAAAAATELFEKTSCINCHTVTRMPGKGKPGTPGEDLPQWRIAPVTAAHAWMPKAKFSHAKHRSADCGDCHTAATSMKASDVLMPEIKVCRDCHSGNTPEKNKVTSDCGLCHGFHQAPHETAAPAGKSAGKQAADRERP